MNELFTVLLRFRAKPYTYTADIQHMFLQVEIEPEDRPYIRVLYQPLRDGPIHLVECQRHMFGLRSSPFVAIEIIKTHAREYADRWPAAARAVAESSIVDDLLVSADTPSELAELHRELEGMFATMSMRVHKCASNHPRLMDIIPADQRAKQVMLEDIQSENPELMPVIKTLGMVYEPATDDFRFEYVQEEPTHYTLRVMVSMVAKLYDPLGLVVSVPHGGTRNRASHMESRQDLGRSARPVHLPTLRPLDSPCQGTPIVENPPPSHRDAQEDR